MDVNNVNDNNEEVEKKKRGRKSTTGLLKKDNKEYFNEYYHLKGTKDLICACGALVKHASMTRHLKRDIHKRRLEKMQQKFEE